MGCSRNHCGEHKESKASDVYGLGYLMKIANSRTSCELGDLFHFVKAGAAADQD